MGKLWPTGQIRPTGLSNPGLQTLVQGMIRIDIKCARFSLSFNLVDFSYYFAQMFYIQPNIVRIQLNMSEDLNNNNMTSDQGPLSSSSLLYRTKMQNS